MSFPFWISFNLGQILFYVQLGEYFFHLTLSHQETIKLIKAVVFVNPFDEVDAVLKEEREKKEEEEKRQEEAARKKKAAATPAEAPKVYRSGVGKYIPQKPASRDADTADLTPQPTKKKIKTSGGFKDFSSW